MLLIIKIHFQLSKLFGFTITGKSTFSIKESVFCKLFLSFSNLLFFFCNIVYSGILYQSYFNIWFVSILSMNIFETEVLLNQ